MTLDKDTLRNSTVVLARFSNVNAIIFQVIVEDQLADAVILDAALRDRLLEIAIETKNLRNNILLLINRSSSYVLYIILLSAP